MDNTTEVQQQMQEFNSSEFVCIVEHDVGELGCGLHSSVRLSRHPTLNWVAIKCFTITGGGSQKKRLEKMIQQELQVLQQAMNNHVVRIYGWVKWPKSMGLVMEFMPGGNLGQFISDGSFRLPLKVTLRVSYETSDGIAFMHNLPFDQRVVHGDLKPENVLLSSELHCKLGDFGCAQLVALTGSTIKASPRIKKTDMTMAYAAPEKLRSFNIKAKKEQDTYSFGMILYVLLTGTSPYQHTSQESAFIELIKEGGRPDTTPINELNETLTNEDKQILETLQSIMEKCWQQEPSDRPSMIEVRDELQELLRQICDAEILKEVAETIEFMTILTPNADEHHFLPLYLFSPIHGTFSPEGTVHNIYNMPNVRQASIDCGTVTFEQPEPVLPNDGSQYDRKQSLASITFMPHFPISDVSNAGMSSADSSTRKPWRDNDEGISPTEEAGPSSVFLSVNQSPRRRPTLKKAFLSPELSFLPGNVQTVPSLLENYKTALKRKEYEKATWITANLICLIENYVDATAEDVRLLGVKLRKDKLYLESIALFDAAAILSEKTGETKENLRSMTLCLQGMKNSNKAIIGDDDSMKAVVRDHVIPLMREKIQHIEDMSRVSEQFKCLQVTWILYFIEYSEYLVGQLNESEKSLHVAWKYIRDVFKSDANKHRIYGYLLNNLGYVYERTSRFDEAVSFYKQAIDAYKTATDYDGNEEERRLDIELSENNLKVVQEKRK